MSPYINLKPVKCMYCENQAEYKCIYIFNGHYTAICKSCLKEKEQ